MLFRLVLLSFVSVFILVCTQKNSSDQNTIDGKITIQNAWARPGSEGMMSAVYLRIANRTHETDTLKGLSTDIALSAEVHESFEGENGMAGMRPAGELPVESGSELDLKPGGYHIMLMQLNRDITKGDSIELTLNFAKAGSLNVRIPVKTQS